MYVCTSTEFVFECGSLQIASIRFVLRILYSASLLLTCRYERVFVLQRTLTWCRNNAINLGKVLSSRIGNGGRKSSAVAICRDVKYSSSGGLGPVNRDESSVVA